MLVGGFLFARLKSLYFSLEIVKKKLFFSRDLDFGALNVSMEDRKDEVQSNVWMSVPAFGDWDLKKGVPDYSMDFSKIREMRKQNKTDFSRASLGNEDELIPNHNHDAGGERRRDNYGQLPHSPTTVTRDHSPTVRKKFKSYFICCIGA